MIVNRANQRVNHGSAAVLLLPSSTKNNKSSWNNLSSNRTGGSSGIRRESHSPISGGLDSMGMLWGGNSLLQPRLISGETGETPLLIKHKSSEGGHRWSGSDRSIDTSIYSGTLIQQKITHVRLAS